MTKRVLSRIHNLSLAGLMILVLCGGCWSGSGTESESVKFPEFWSTDQKSAYHTNVAENLIESMTVQLKPFKSKMAGSTTGLDGLFADKVSYRGPVALEGANQFLAAGKGVSVFEWPVGELETVVADNVWESVRKTGKFSKTKLGILSGLFPEERLNEFKMKTIIEAHFHPNDSGGTFGVVAEQTLHWKQVNGTDWRITKWEQDRFRVIATPETLFVDKTNDWITSKATQELVARSPIEEMILLESAGKTYPQLDDDRFMQFNDWRSTALYSCVSVVDYDLDGWEDIFLTGVTADRYC